MNNYYNTPPAPEPEPTVVYHNNCDCNHNPYPNPNPPPGENEWGGRKSYKDYPQEERRDPPPATRLSSFQDHYNRYYKSSE